jgi:hypothetical protein
MDWSVFWYLLAAIVAAGLGYTAWPKHRLLPRKVVSLSGETPQDDAPRSEAA